MLTYVINTSENKIFDSNLLFELAGYNKIRWMHCSLDKVKECAIEICDKQNVLGADAFRIAVIVDFYCFDRIRRPYGYSGYTEDSGVDLCLYYPYIETYLSDHLLSHLDRNNLHAATCEIYYIQNEKNDKYSNIANRKEQLRKIMKAVDFGGAEIELPEEKKEPAHAGDVEAGFTGQSGKTEQGAGKNEDEEKTPEEKYPKFRLYCTPGVSLDFEVKDYPYCGGAEMTFSDFIREFEERYSGKRHIMCHSYVTAYGCGSAMAAFDTLALSLYLVHMYEREEDRRDSTDFEIDHLDPIALRNVLEKAWNKIHCAKELAQENKCEYYALDFEIANGKKKKEEYKEPDEKEELRKFRAAVKPADLDFSSDDLYKKIVEYASRRMNEPSEADREELDGLMRGYLENRDGTREVGVQSEFEQLCATGAFKMQKQCPSKLQYDIVVEERQTKISEIFERTLKAEYLKTDYAEVYKEASEHYAEHKELMRRRSRWIIADIALFIIMVASILVPFHYMQALKSGGVVYDIMRYIWTAVPFMALFVLCFIIIVITISIRLKRVRERLQLCLEICIAKHAFSMSALKRRYEKELPEIEKIRYEIRGIANLQEKNIEKNRNIRLHRETLENVENRLSAILNNLGVEPKPEKHEDLSDEFDAQKPINAPINSVYRIFSVEAIESMFPDKGGKQ